MTLTEIAYLLGTLIAFLTICSLPGLASLGRAGPHYRRAVRNYLVLGWISSLLTIGFVLLLGWRALEIGGKIWNLYCNFTLVFLCLYFPLLVLKIRAVNRRLAEAQQLDAAPATGS